MAERESDVEAAAVIAAARNLPDRELSRLLRKSYQFVRTRTRRGVLRATSLREKAPDWTLQEMLLLGMDVDGVIAQKVGRPRRAVGFKRRRLHLSAVGRWRPWKTEDLALFGTKTDAEIARLLARTTQAIAAKRKVRGVPNVAPAPPQRPWKRWEVRLLGTLPDAVLAKKLSRPGGGSPLILHH